MEEEKIYKQDLDAVIEFIEKTALHDYIDGIGEAEGFLLMQLVKLRNNIDASWEMVSEVDMGPAGEVYTYLLAWIEDGKMQKQTIVDNLGNWTLQ